MARREVVLGLHPAKGAAVAVAVSGRPEAPDPVLRDSFPLVPDRAFELRQPYHAAEGRPLGEGEELVRRAIDSARTCAADGLATLLERLDGDGRRVSTIALSSRPEVPLEPVDEILRSHVRMHAAEGEVLRHALRWAAGRGDTPAVTLLERELSRLVAGRLGTTEDDVATRVSALGKPLGAPWRQEHKTAALAAWLVLAGGAG